MKPLHSISFNRVTNRGFSSRASVTQKPLFPSIKAAIVHFQQFPFEQTGAIYGSDFAKASTIADLVGFHGVGNNDMYNVVPAYMDKLQVNTNLEMASLRTQELEGRFAALRELYKARAKVEEEKRNPLELEPEAIVKDLEGVKQ